MKLYTIFSYARSLAKIKFNKPINIKLGRSNYNTTPEQSVNGANA